MTAIFADPNLFAANHHFSDEVNHNIIQSEIEGGVYLRDLLYGDVLHIETDDWTCRLLYCEDGQAWISGHPKFCPQPVKVHINGSTWGGSMIKQSFIGRGMHLEIEHPQHQRILTSTIIEIRALPSAHRLKDVTGVLVAKPL